MTYGKIFRSMFEGSMVGAGSHVFSVMGYIITHMQPDKNTREEYVKLNSRALAGIIGDSVERMQEAIDFLCAPDGETTTSGQDGCRLKMTEPYEYWVVNGKKYRELKDDEDRREQAAERQRRHRDKKAAADTLKAAKKLKVPLMAHEKPYLDGVVAGRVDADTGNPLPPEDGQ